MNACKSVENMDHSAMDMGGAEEMDHSEMDMGGADTAGAMDPDSVGAEAEHSGHDMSGMAPDTSGGATSGQGPGGSR